MQITLGYPHFKALKGSCGLLFCLAGPDVLQYKTFLVNYRMWKNGILAI